MCQESKIARGRSDELKAYYRVSKPHEGGGVKSPPLYYSTSESPPIH